MFLKCSIVFIFFLFIIRIALDEQINEHLNYYSLIRGTISDI